MRRRICLHLDGAGDLSGVIHYGGLLATIEVDEYVDEKDDERIPGSQSELRGKIVGGLPVTRAGLHRCRPRTVVDLREITRGHDPATGETGDGRGREVVGGPGYDGVVAVVPARVQQVHYRGRDRGRGDGVGRWRTHARSGSRCADLVGFTAVVDTVAVGVVIDPGLNRDVDRKTLVSRMLKTQRTVGLYTGHVDGRVQGVDILQGRAGRRNCFVPSRRDRGEGILNCAIYVQTGDLGSGHERSRAGGGVPDEQPGLGFYPIAVIACRVVAGGSDSKCEYGIWSRN